MLPIQSPRVWESAPKAIIPIVRDVLRELATTTDFHCLDDLRQRNVFPRFARGLLQPGGHDLNAIGRADPQLADFCTAAQQRDGLWFEWIVAACLAGYGATVSVSATRSKRAALDVVSSLGVGTEATRVYWSCKIAGGAGPGRLSTARAVGDELVGRGAATVLVVPRWQPKEDAAVRIGEDLGVWAIPPLGFVVDARGLRNSLRIKQILSGREGAWRASKAPT